jgi:hypothetical protein
MILDSIKLSEKDAQGRAQVTVDAASVAAVLSLMLPKKQRSWTRSKARQKVAFRGQGRETSAGGA